MAEERVLNISQDEIEKGKSMAAIAYLVFFIPLVIDEYKKNKFVMFHTEQAIVCLILNLFCGIGIIFAIIGLINALGGKVVELPLVGQFGRNFNLVK